MGPRESCGGARSRKLRLILCKRIREGRTVVIPCVVLSLPGVLYRVQSLKEKEPCPWDEVGIVSKRLLPNPNLSLPIL